jgi:D-alanyl-D-alanine carboxypeptidase
VLAPLQPITVPVQHDGSTLYRARFAGLSDKEEARAVCAKLKSRSIHCLAMPS